MFVIKDTNTGTYFYSTKKSTMRKWVDISNARTFLGKNHASNCIGNEAVLTFSGVLKTNLKIIPVKLVEA